MLVKSQDNVDIFHNPWWRLGLGNRRCLNKLDGSLTSSGILTMVQYRKLEFLFIMKKKMYYYTKNYETSIIVVFCHVLLRKLRKYKNKLKEFWQSVYDYDYPNGDGDLMVFVVNPYFSHPI